MSFISLLSICYRPQRSWSKVMFLHVSVILFKGGGCYPSMHCRWYPSMPCSRSGGWYPSMPCRSPGPHPGGKVEGSGLGGLQAHTWGVSRPTPGVSPGPHLGCLQAHTWGVSRPTPGGLQAHTQGGSQAHTQGTPSMH